LPRLRVEPDQLRQILVNDVLKREAVDSEEATQAAQALGKALRSAQKAKGPISKVVMNISEARPEPSIAVPDEPIISIPAVRVADE
jgi:hypothetical protein